MGVDPTFLMGAAAGVVGTVISNRAATWVANRPKSPSVPAPASSAAASAALKMPTTEDADAMKPALGKEKKERKKKEKNTAAGGDGGDNLGA